MIAKRLSSLTLVALVAALGCGKSRGTNPPSSTVTFEGGAIDGSNVTVETRVCVRCHGDAARASATGDSPGVAFAPPVDVDGNQTGAKIGAHMAHLKAGAMRNSGVACANCHIIPGSGAQHTPGVRFRGVAATVWSGGTAISPDYDGTTCTNTYCHGAFTGGLNASPTWTGSATQAACGTCHALPPAAPHPAGADCGTCHPGYGTGATPSIDSANDHHVDGTLDGGCTGCHGDATRANGGVAGVAYDRFQTAAPPPTSSAYSTSTVVVGAHIAHVNPTPSQAAGAQPTGGVYKPIACTECHPDNSGVTHPNGTLTVTFNAATGAKLTTYPASATQGNGQTTETTCSTYCHNGVAGSGTASWTGADATCGSCHGFPPASHSASLDTAAECAGCHDQTVNVDGTINIAGGFHINGIVEGGESTGGFACGTCHSAIVTAMTTAASSKHSLVGWTDTATDSGGAWGTATTLDSILPANRTCVNMCHSDHPHDVPGTSTTHEHNLYANASSPATRAATATATTTNRAKTDFVAAGGGLCVSCHQTPISAVGGPTIVAADYAASAHHFTSFASGATWTWRYALHSGNFDRNCTKCHASATEGTTPTATATGSATTAVHSSANASLLAGAATPIGAGNVCYNCHGSAAPVDGQQGNRSGKNIQAQFAKASNHNPAGSCLDCHAPHAAKAGTHATPGNLAGPPIHGAAGAVLATNPAYWADPVSNDFNAKTIVSGTDLEASLCFKCHSAFGGTLPTGTTDVAKEFNPNNVGNYATTGTTSWQNLETAGSFHPVLASAGGNLGATDNVKSPWTRTSLMTCTDCHESNNTADPNGPHGSTASFILKGPNTLWSASLATQSTGMPANTFCINCHNQDYTGSRFMPNGTLGDGHTKGNHLIACFNCHAAVPHGGPRPGLLVAIKGVRATSPAPPPVITEWDRTAPYYQGTAAVDATKNGLYLKSYPSNSTTSWEQANCGCNNTGSH